MLLICFSSEIGLGVMCQYSVIGYITIMNMHNMVIVGTYKYGESVFITNYYFKNNLPINSLKCTTLLFAVSKRHARTDVNKSKTHEKHMVERVKEMHTNCSPILCLMYGCLLVLVCTL